MTHDVRAGGRRVFHNSGDSQASNRMKRMVWPGSRNRLKNQLAGCCCAGVYISEHMTQPLTKQVAPSNAPRMGMLYKTGLEFLLHSVLSTYRYRDLKYMLTQL
jgi:hypothetical protein